MKPKITLIGTLPPIKGISPFWNYFLKNLKLWTGNCI